jgi:transposase
MDSRLGALPDDIEALKAALVAEASRAAHAEAELAVARAKAADDQALIAHQQLRIEKLTRQLYGPRSERSSRLLDQIELQFEELESSATEDEIAAEMAVAKTTTVAAFTRKRPARKPFPEHLPRERVIVPGPTICLCCGGSRLRKLGETVTETLESVPRQWKVIQHVREKFTCRDCEKISQAPAPFHVIARGWAGPSLLAMILFEKFGQHQPLNRQAERYAREGVPLSLSTLADQVGAGCAVLQPILRRIEAHVFAAERLHGDDTTVPVLAKGKTDTGRCWVYVRDDLPFGGPAPPAAMFYYSRDRAGEHPQAHLANYTGIFQADAYSGYNKLYEPDRKPRPILEAACWVHYLESDIIWSRRPRPQSWSMTSGRRTPHKKGGGSERLQEGEQVRLRLPRFGLGRFDPRVLPKGLHCVALHLKVGGDVPTGRGDAGVTQIVANHGDVSAGLQQRHGAAMAKHMRRDALARQRRVSFGRDRRHVFAQDVGDAVAAERQAVLVDEDVLLFSGRRHSAQPVQRVGSLPPKRQQPLFPSLAAEPYLPRRNQL